MYKNNIIDKNEYHLSIVSSDCNNVVIKNLNNKNLPTSVNFNVDKQYMQRSNCPYLNKCGNCKLLEVNYSAQLELKQQFVADLFKGFNVQINNIVGMYYPFKYRNKVHFSISEENGKTIVGFIKEGSSTVTEIPKCLIHDSWFEILYSEIKKYIKFSKVKGYNKFKQTGELRYIVARYLDGNLLLTLVATKDIYNGLKQFYSALKEKFKQVSIYVNINNTKTSAVFSNNFKYKLGSPSIQGSLCGVNFEISPKSFLQVNLEIASKIYNKVTDMLCIEENQTVIDCYSGIGISSLIFAKKGATVESIEIEKNACKDAITLAKNNGLKDKIKVNCGDCNVLIPQVVSKYKDSIMFVDPPRSGLGENFINTVINSKVKRIVYLSCNPITLLSDLKKLTKSFNIKSITPFDMFPHTKHIEILTLLELK